MGYQKCCLAKRQRNVKKVLYVIFFDNMGKVMQLPVQKGRTVTRAFYKNVVLKKLKAHFKRHCPKTGLKYLHLLHDKAIIVTKFLKSKCSTTSPFSPDLAPSVYLLFPKLKFHLSGKRYKSRNALVSAVYHFLMGVPI